jgi:hypothetical protein
MNTLSHCLFGTVVLTTFVPALAAQPVAADPEPAPPAAAPPTVVPPTAAPPQQQADAPAPDDHPAPKGPPGSQFGPTGVPGLGGPFDGPGDRFGAGGGFNGAGGLVPSVGYQATWLPSQSAGNGTAHLGMVRQDFFLNEPLYTDGQNFLIGRIGVREERFQTNVILPDSQQPFPNELWNIHFGLTGLHRFDNGWSAGGGVSFGSASDKPFDTINTLNVGLNAFLRIPVHEHDAWLLTLGYSPLGQLSFPVPGVAYSWNPSPQFSANIGLPARVVYRPTDQWVLEASYMLLTTVHARATYLPHGPDWTKGMRIYGAFDWSNESYYLSEPFPGNPDQSSSSFQRFFYYEKRLSAGVYFPVNKHLGFDLSTGYAFDRYYLRGKAFGNNGLDHVDVGDGPFLSGQARLRW